MTGHLVRSLIAGLLVAGIVHVLAILTIPSAAPNDATARVLAVARPGVVALIPSDGSVLADLDPYFLHAACAFDLTGGTTTTLAGALPDEVWTIAVVSRAGGMVASFEQDAAPNGTVSLAVGMADAVERLRLAGTLPADGFTVEAPAGPGFVLVRVAAADIESRPRIRAALQALTCAQAARPSGVRPLAPLPPLPEEEPEPRPAFPLPVPAPR
ncbi:hypothetical protein [Chthonobacter rhizosphaerae]|uniref:hypothetical protein n=1 Tax=Chthonobacter rhizosphaerae TaxID=2735553 RepID=UPI0015EF8DA0|nr:hypothetical protein [Chthonobacter rhizosphaerae]